MSESDIRSAISGAEAAPEPTAGGKLDLGCARLLQNDIGNAERLCKRHGKDLIYVREIGWLGWTGTHWSAEEGRRRIELAAQSVARAIFGEAAAIETWPPDDLLDDAEDGKKKWRTLIGNLRSWANESGMNPRISAMQRLAEPHLAKRTGDLDTDGLLLSVANGTLALLPDGSWRLRKHARRDFVTRVSPVAYDPDAEAPIFEDFVTTILPDVEVRDWVRRYFGYCLTGLKREQVVALFYGTGSNGKSTLCETIAWVLGEYAHTLDFSSLVADDKRRGSEATPDLAQLPGVRAVFAAEPEGSVKLSEGKIKSMTGGDKLNVRKLNKDFFQLLPVFKLVLSFNNKPRVQGQDHGIWRRLRLIPFTVQVPDEKQDLSLPEKLRLEGPGILNWMLKGYAEWAELGLGLPDAIREATDDYREDSDPVAVFLEVATRRVPGSSVTAKLLYDTYIGWCKANSAEPLSHTGFGRMLTTRGINREKAGIVYYQNIELIENQTWKNSAKSSEDYGDPRDADG